MKKFKSNRIITKKILFCLLSFCLFSKAKTQDSTAYPLDPLTANEIKKVVLILKSSKTITGRIFFNVINLKEPPKKEVLAYKPGSTFRREAFASFYVDSTAGMTEAVVDLNTEKVVSIKKLYHASTVVTKY